MKNIQLAVGIGIIAMVTIILSDALVPKVHAQWSWWTACANTGRTCPACVPFGACSVLSGMSCQGFGGSDGCSASVGWPVGTCTGWSSSDCLHIVNFCGNAMTPWCQPIKNSTGLVIACQPGGCVPGGGANCGGC